MLEDKINTLQDLLDKLSFINREMQYLLRAQRKGNNDSKADN